MQQILLAEEIEALKLEQRLTDHIAEAAWAILRALRITA